MAFCSFDEGAALFDCTPVENMFISEYMLRAPGDFVKVYLYALMLCYHDQQRMSLSAMARDLDMTEEEVERAFRYWERNGLLRRTGDNPTRFSLRNVKQLTLSRAENPGEQLYNRWFTEEIRRILEGHIFGEPDYGMINDWVEIYKLSEEVVLMLLQTQVDKLKKSGKRFSFSVADEIAREWADRGVRNVEDVERLVVLEEERTLELRRLLARLGQHINPSDDDKKLYSKWRDEWGFTADAIQEACSETTKGAPTMAYLDGILLRQHQLGRHDAQELRAGLKDEQSDKGFAREIYAGLGRVGVTPPNEDLKTIADWLADGYSQKMILLAARDVYSRNKGGTLEDVGGKLAQWRKQGLTSVEQIEAARARARVLNARLHEIYAAAGIEKRVNQPDRALLSKWADEWGMSEELILLAAQFARGNAAPLPVADRILSDWHSAGIRDAQAARAEHEAHMQGRRRAAAPAPAAPMLRHTQEERRATYSAAVVDLDEEEDE